MTPSHRRITLKDLAARLEVSTATVSNAFNRPDQLSPALRDRILSEARDVGYVGPMPEAAACAPGARKSLRWSWPIV
ncbi:LacI family DNA-binding transcriptional regulator [Chromohalobacter israelensis]|uniref:LacI family DNA-binding transcriptional regulator n=1 Tax=Chromohalobacter israelensis TaxID=141390 RepID=UPI001FD0A0FC|nr:LacI family DNA-binding transcriptional regulator [Chromohalobacter salexigens]